MISIIKIFLTVLLYVISITALTLYSDLGFTLSCVIIVSLSLCFHHVHEKY